MISIPIYFITNRTLVNEEKYFEVIKKVEYWPIIKELNIFLHLIFLRLNVKRGWSLRVSSSLVSLENMLIVK